MSSDARQPQAFTLDGEKVTATTSTRSRVKPEIEFEAEPAAGLVVVPATAVPPRPRRMPWLYLLVGSLLALAVLWTAQSVTALVQSLFTQSSWLGWPALALAVVAAASFLALLLRETWGLIRLGRVEHLQDSAARAVNLNDPAAARQTVEGLKGLFAGRSDLALPLRELASQERTFMDAPGQVRIAERLLIEPLDGLAEAVIARRARRVAMITTVTPVASLDMLVAGYQNFAMLREIATLYGGRPSSLATFRLARMVVTHLALAGGIALSDAILPNILGKGLLGRVSARLGEGAMNGVLTTRIGLAAMEVCRPVPRTQAARTSLAALVQRMLTPDAKAVAHQDSGLEPQAPREDR